MTHSVSDSAIELIKKFEGYRSKPYLDPVNIPTIGYGTTYYPDGSKVKMTDKPVTPARATEILKHVVNDFARGVDAATGGAQLTCNQAEALVSFAYNIGIGAFKKSTLLKKVLSNPNDPAIRAEFMRWNKANSKVLAGLTTRRKLEADLYFKG